MAKFAVMASELKSLKKSIEDKKLAELKKEIIEILKKQDEKDFKKAIDYFESQELHFTHLEKSLVSGKWIEKAGYGVGTVRIWKGKKYKKIAPGKWARVFDKEGRGTNIAIGKLIARVNKIDNAEDLLQFVMENKQRFIDEDGRELGILDKVRAAVDTRNEKLSGESSPYVYGVGENVNRAKNEMFSKKDKIKKEEADLHKVSRKLSQIPTTELKQEKARLERAVENKTRSKRDSLNNVIFRESNQEKLDAINKELEKRSKETSKPAEKNSLSDKDKKMMKDFDLSESDYLYLKNKVFDELNPNKDGIETGVSIQGLAGELYEKDNKFKKLVDKIEAQRPGSSRFYGDFMYNLKNNENQVEKEEEYKTYWIQDPRGNRLTNEDAKKKIIGQMKYLAELEDMAGKKMNNRLVRDTEYYIDYLKDRLNPEDRKEIESEAEKHQNRSDAMKGNKNAEKEPETKENNSYDNMTEKEINAEVSKELDKLAEKSKKPTIHEAANYIKENNKELYNNLEKRWGDSLISALADVAIDRKNKKDNEAEKYQNRSEAMKGNQNAKKYGLTDEQIERYDIQEVVEDVNGYGIVKNSEGKYSYIDDGRVKDRPDDFETSIEKVKERINDTYETKKNIQAAKDYDFKNAKLGSDIEYTKRSDGKHLYFKKSPDGSKAISVTVEVSDMREPLNMTYEVSDTKSGESWQYETAYGNKEGLEWAVERPEQMEKELKKFFKRDPEKEWNKQNTSDSITNFESEGKVVSYDGLQPIATNKSVGENEVQMPYSKDLADEIESLKNCAAPEWENREFMKHVYYDDGNLVTTDGRRLKIVKVGKLDGIQDGTYVDITTDKSGINIKKREGMEDYRFPTYKKVMPDNLSQNVTLDSKLVKEKIKAMQKDGAIDKKGANIVQLEFRDGKVFIDDTAVGDAKDIQLKTSESWNDPKEDTNYVHFNADYLTNALSGKTAVLQMGDDNHKAMAINTGSTSNVLMPMHGLNAKMDYSSNRSVKAAENEAKDKKKADNRKHSEQLIKDLNEEKIKESIENVAKDIDRQCETSDDDFLRSAYEKLNFNFDKILDKKRYITVHDKVNKDGLTFISAYMHSRLAKEHPEVKEKIAAELEKRGISVKKSLFDDFIVDVFEANDEEEIEDELYEGETEYNDYSAEQPELFNSTSMKVCEALDRIKNQVL